MHYPSFYTTSFSVNGNPNYIGLKKFIPTLNLPIENLSMIQLEINSIIHLFPLIYMPKNTRESGKDQKKTFTHSFTIQQNKIIINLETEKEKEKGM